MKQITSALLALSLLSGCAPKATKDSLVGTWSLDAQSLETMIEQSDPSADEANIKMAQMFIKIATRGLALEFTETEMRQIQSYERGESRPYTVESVEGNQISINIAGQSFTYTILSDGMEFTPPGSELRIKFNRLNDAELQKLNEQIEMAKDGPSPEEPAEQRFMWLLNAPEDRVVAYMVKYPDIVEVKDEKGRTLLHRIASFKKLDLAKLAIEHGAQLTAADQDSETPFHVSLGFDFDPELSKRLFTPGIDIEQKDRFRRTLLEKVLRKEDIEKATFLIELGADVEAGKEPGEKTPFLLAIEKSQLRAAKFLLDNGADIHRTVFSSEHNALDVATRYGSLETIQFLLDAGLSPKPVENKKSPTIGELRFRQDQQAEALKLLIDAGADINQLLPGSSTLLSSAIKRENIDFAKALIGADADYTMKISFRKSAYELAQEQGLDELVALMDAQAAQ